MTPAQGPRMPEGSAAPMALDSPSPYLREPISGEVAQGAFNGRTPGLRAPGMTLPRMTARTISALQTPPVPIPTPAEKRRPPRGVGPSRRRRERRELGGASKASSGRSARSFRASRPHNRSGVCLPHGCGSEAPCGTTTNGNSDHRRRHDSPKCIVGMSSPSRQQDSSAPRGRERLGGGPRRLMRSVALTKRGAAQTPMTIVAGTSPRRPGAAPANSPRRPGSRKRRPTPTKDPGKQPAKAATSCGGPPAVATPGTPTEARGPGAGVKPVRGPREERHHRPNNDEHV